MHLEIKPKVLSKHEVARDKFKAGSNFALVPLGKAVTFLFVHLELNVKSILITQQK